MEPTDDTANAEAGRAMRPSGPRTLYDKLWDAHAVAEDDGETLLYIDLHLLHEVTSPQAFAGLAAAGRTVRRPERALGLSFMYASQTWKQMVVSYGEDEARSIFGLTNNLMIFGGGKDINFYREMSELIDDVRTSRQTVTDGPGGVVTSRAGEWERVMRPGDIRRLKERHALVIAGNAPPIIARLSRCIDGRDGARLKAEQAALRKRVAAARQSKPDIGRRTAAAVAYSRANALTPDTGGDREAEGSGEWPWN